MMFKRILLATDGSPVMERVVLFAGHMARVEHAEVIVLHAYEPLSRYQGYAGFEKLVEQYQAVAQSLVDDTVNQLREDGVQARGELRMGPAADAIIAAAVDYDTTLIVMGTRGSSNLKDILGSVSAHVLRYARCPVLQVP
jgi:nucleotide-binding universal stress UspA family protein